MPEGRGRVARWVGFALVVAGAATVAWAFSRAPEALARLELFRARAVVVEGARFLDRSEAVEAAAIPAGASVWDDFEPWRLRLAAHPLVKDASIGRRLPDTIVLRVEEREPVAFLPTPTLEPVDAEGRVLPVDPSVHTLDLPLLAVDGPGGAAPEASRVRALVAELARLERAEPGFTDALSELAWDDEGDVVALWGNPAVRLRFRAPVTVRRVREALQVLGDAGARYPERRVETVDLRYDDQVVVRFNRAG